MSCKSGEGMSAKKSQNSVKSTLPSVSASISLGKIMNVGFKRQILTEIFVIFVIIIINVFTYIKMRAM